MEQIQVYGHLLNENEKEVIDYILKAGRGLALKSKKELKDYPNLINNQLVYVDYWGGVSLKATDKGKAFFNNIIQ